MISNSPANPPASSPASSSVSPSQSGSLIASQLEALGLPDPETLPHFRVSELTFQLSECVKSYFSNLNLRGEVGSLKRGRGGHVFLTLKEGDASIDAVIWSREVGGLNFFPKVGDEVMVNGDLRLRPKSGNASFQIRHLMPTGEGLMQAEFERVCAEFQERGLFNRATPLPRLPQCVGLVTSYQTSAYYDFYKTHSERAPGVKVIFEDAVVQGNGSCASLSAALKRLYAHPEVDVIALTRGGGSMEHLWDFNNPELCQLITQSPKPIVVGIGHEDNTLLAELVADVRGYTPTGVASAIFPNVADLRRGLNALSDRLEHQIFAIGNHCEQRLQRMKLALAPLCATDARRQQLEQRYFGVERAIDDQIGRARLELDQLSERLHHEAPHLRVERAHHALLRLIDELKRIHPAQRLSERQEGLTQRLDGEIDQTLDHAKRRLVNLAQQLEVLSPLKTLARGYSLVRDDAGDAITDSGQVTAGDSIKITLRTGALTAQVQEVERAGGEEIAEPTGGST